MNLETNLPTKFIQNILESVTFQIYNQIHNLDDLNISIRFCHPNYGCDYTSAIAYQLSSKLAKTPTEIAQTLYQSISTTEQLVITITDRGMINFKLTETYIQTCLDHIAIADLSLNYLPQPQNFPLFTHTQYAYARCCSLLRMVESVNIRAAIVSPELALTLIDIAENLDKLSEPQVIKCCQNLTLKFLELSDRSSNSQVLSTSILKITQKLIYTLASGYINLSEYL